MRDFFVVIKRNYISEKDILILIFSTSRSCVYCIHFLRSINYLKFHKVMPTIVSALLTMGPYQNMEFHSGLWL